MRLTGQTQIIVKYRLLVGVVSGRHPTYDPAWRGHVI
jgi:hypothetical protein